MNTRTPPAKQSVSCERKDAEEVPSTGDFRRYRHGRKIADALQGCVRYGKDTVTDQWVVLKVCNLKLVAEKRSRTGGRVQEDVAEEIRLHRKLSKDPDPCPYIIEQLDVCSDMENKVIVLEYAQNGDLFKTVQQEIKQLLPIRRTNTDRLRRWHDYVRKWMKQILTAMQYMHDRGICHRDLSLENCVLDGDLNVKLIDFGMAASFQKDRFGRFDWFCDQRVGKPTYASEECWLGYYNARANDVWCFGIMLFMALTAAQPWEEARSSNQRYQRICKWEGPASGLREILTVWKREDMVPDEALDLLARIFVQESERITVAQALKHPFITGEKPLKGKSSSKKSAAAETPPKPDHTSPHTASAPPPADDPPSPKKKPADKDASKKEGAQLKPSTIAIHTRSVKKASRKLS